jgi:SAM-dependent methyltransferase
MKNNNQLSYKMIKKYYDEVYYRNVTPQTKISLHHNHLAERINIHHGQYVLDIGCGSGDWLRSLSRHGAFTVGLDISSKALTTSKANVPLGRFLEGCAENLPFRENTFDVVTCLGSLEHFLDPTQALREMARVAKENAVILILVPNAGFLTGRLGFFSGTNQFQIKEEVLHLHEWKSMFEGKGLCVRQRWRDLHILSWRWIKLSGWRNVPLRTAQALVLAIWPLKWQYQVYHLCTKSLLS